MALAQSEMDASLGGDLSTNIIGGADGPTQVFVNGGDTLGIEDIFTTEAMDAFYTALEAFSAAIVVSEPTTQTLLTASDDEIAAQHTEFSISNEALASFVKALFELLLSNEQFAAGFEAAIAESGEEMTFYAETLYETLISSGMTVEGDIYVTEAGDIYADNYLIYPALDGGEDNYIYLGLQMTSDEDGQYFDAYLKPDDTSAMQFCFATDVNPEVEGKTDYYAQLTVWNLVGEEPTATADFCYIYSSYLDEDGNVRSGFDITVTSDGQGVNFGGIGYGDETIEGGNVYVYMCSDVDSPTSGIVLGYDGTISGTAHEGNLWGTVTVDDAQKATLSCGVAFGAEDASAGISYDFSSVPAVDLSTADEDTVAALEQSLYSVLYKGIIVVAGNIPYLSTLLASMM